jgi:hypothetical protein
MNMETPRKVDASHIEVIGKTGEVIRESEDSKAANPFSGFSGIRVIQGGPAMLLLLPILIPVMIVGFFVLMVFALVFGRGVFKVATRTLRRH